MPGWTTGDNLHNNIAYTPGTWIALHRICEKHGVGDQFRIHYDPSHAILMGQDTRSIFQYLKDEGYNFLIGGFHVKGQVIDAEGRRRRGATAARPWSAATGSTASRRRTRPISSTRGRSRSCSCEHELPGTARHDPLAYLQNRTVDWLDHQLAARELLQLDVANTHLVVEHEYPKARIQDRATREADPAGLDRVRPRASTRRRPACTRCSTRCWRRRASAAGRRPPGVPELKASSRNCHVSAGLKSCDVRRSDGDDCASRIPSYVEGSTPCGYVCSA